MNPENPVKEVDLVAAAESKMFEGKKVYIALPFYKSTDPRTAFSIMALLDRKRTTLALDMGDAFISHARCKLADNFLKTKCEWMLSIDDDMMVPFGDANLFRSFTGFSFLSDKYAGQNTIDRLISHGRTLVGGLYFGRWSHGKAVFAEGSENKREEEFCRRGPHDILKPTRWVGTGCMLVHRTVLTDIEKTFPHLARKADGTGGNWFTSSEHDTTASVSEALKKIEDGADIKDIEAILRRGQDRSRKFSGLGMGEDVSFCIRAAQSGHQPYVDLGLLCGHYGSYCYGPRKS